MVIFALPGPKTLKGIKYFDLLFRHNHSLTKSSICNKFDRTRRFELYYLLLGYLMHIL